MNSPDFENYQDEPQKKKLTCGKFSDLIAKSVKTHLESDEVNKPIVYYHNHWYQFRLNKYVKLRHGQEEDVLRFILMESILYSGEKVDHNNSLVANILPKLRILCNKKVRDRQEDLPIFIDEEEYADPKKLIALDNGLFNLNTKKLIDHTDDYLNINVLPYEYDQDAKCPNFKAFLNDIYFHDLEQVKLLQEWFGYCLLRDNKYQKFMLIYGPPRSGKGVLARLLKAFIGEENYAGIKLTDITDIHMLDFINTKLLASIGEINLSKSIDRTTIYQNFNSIVGCDYITARALYEAPYTTQIKTKFLLSANEMPFFFDDSGALSARMLVIRHAISFEGKEDINLDQKLEKELPGIFNWAVEGYHRLKNQGMFTVTPTMQEIILEYKKKTCPIKEFVNDVCRLWDKVDPKNFSCPITSQKLLVERNKLHNYHQAWLKKNNINDENASTNLFRQLKILIPKLRNDGKISLGQFRTNAYVGIDVREDLPENYLMEV